jgi:phytoene dehydrogenase-like protein
MAGLSTGCYAQMNGFETHIFERHVTPGGVCTSWNRKGSFDCCIHNPAGSREGTGLNYVWRELHAVPDR